MLLLDDSNGLFGGGLAELFELGRAELMRPRFEYLYDLRPAVYLMTCVIPDHGGDLIQECSHGLGLSGIVGHHHFFGVETVLGGLALDGVRRQCEGRSHESDEGRVRLLGLLRETSQYFPDEGQRLVEVDVLDIPQFGDVLLIRNFRGNDRPDPLHDIELDAQGRQRREYVREHDDPVHPICAMALQAELDGHARRLAAFPEGILVGVLAEGGHVPSGLTHEPYRCAFGDLSPGAAHEDVAIGGGVGCGGGRGGSFVGHGRSQAGDASRDAGARC
mmetsp:Transcript_2228/g.5468  ORF Transcript_2228/g.5468 Transcript_2228/m.5468 type:complete len:275 (-) Transcript_2228:2-826(-)